MAVNSAEELAALIDGLSTQFGTVHHSEANNLWTLANAHIEHVAQECGQWVSHAIEDLLSEWQTHKHAIQAAEAWFAQHAPLLRKVAGDATHLSTEVFSGGTTGGGSTGSFSFSHLLYEGGPWAAIGGYGLAGFQFFRGEDWNLFAKPLQFTLKGLKSPLALLNVVGAGDSFYRADQAFLDGNVDLGTREVIDGVWQAGSVVPVVAYSKLAFDGGFEIGRVIDGDFSNLGGTDHHWISGPASGGIYSYAESRGHGDEVDRYSGVVGFARFGRDSVGAVANKAKELLHL